MKTVSAPNQRRNAHPATPGWADDQVMPTKVRSGATTIWTQLSLPLRQDCRIEFVPRPVVGEGAVSVG